MSPRPSGNPLLGTAPAIAGGSGVAAAEREMAARPHVKADRRMGQRHKSDLRDARQAVGAGEALGELPGPGEAVHVLISGRFSLWDCVPAIAAKLGRLDRLHVATLGFSRRNVEAMGRLMDAGTVGTLRLLCSHYFKGTSPDLYRFATDELAARPGAEFLSVRTHCKLLLVAAGERRLAVESSANLRSCKNLEQLTAFGSPAVYDFHTAWIDELFTMGADFVNCYTGAKAA